MAKIGLSKPYYAIYSNSGGTVRYSSGGLMGKAIEVDVSIESANDNNLYADNIIAETDRTFGSGTITLTTDDLSQAVSKAILGVQEATITGITGITDTSPKELIYDDRQASPYLGIGFIIKKKVGGVDAWRAIVLRKVMFSVPADAAETQGESIEWQTPTIEGTVMRDDSTYHTWKSETTLTTEAQAEAYIKSRLNIT